MSIIEKLGITPGPWEHIERCFKYDTWSIGVTIPTKGNLLTTHYIAHVSDGIQNTEAHASIIASAPEMLEALICGIIMIENKNNFITVDSPEYNFRNNSISIIEKATGKTWEEIKEFINDKI